VTRNDALPGPVAGTLARRPSSVRRTATIDMTWPDGIGTSLHLVGRARDLLTPTDGEPVVVDDAALHATIGHDRTITAITARPERSGIGALVGARGGTDLRGAIDHALPGEREAATPLHVLLDDMAGTSLIAGFAWSRWDPDMAMRMRGARGGLGVRKGRIICSGLRPGGYVHLATASERGERGDLHDIRPAVGDLSDPDDHWAWHELPERPPVSMRRHRRIDVWRDDGDLVVDEFFRDSCWDPDGTEMVLHEYAVAARVDAPSGVLRSVTATPRVLPFPECPWAAPNVVRLEGMAVRTFRGEVQQTLTELDCCTHLNDMLRCLAEVPALASALPGSAADRIEAR